MWGERLKGIVVVFLLGLLTIGTVRFLVGRYRSGQPLGISPGQIEKSVLGVIDKFKGVEDSQYSSVNGSESPIGAIEEKAKDLMNDLKNLPRDQVETIRKQVLKEVCESIEKEDEEQEVLVASDSAQTEGEGNDE